MQLNQQKLRRVTRELKAAREECPEADTDLLVRMLQFTLRMNRDEAQAYYDAAQPALVA